MPLNYLYKGTFPSGHRSGKYCLLMSHELESKTSRTDVWRFEFQQIGLPVLELLWIFWFKWRVARFMRDLCPRNKRSCIGVYRRNVITFNQTFNFMLFWCFYSSFDFLLQSNLWKLDGIYSRTTLFWIWNAKGFIFTDLLQFFLPFTLYIPSKEKRATKTPTFFVTYPSTIKPRRPRLSTFCKPDFVHSNLNQVKVLSLSETTNLYTKQVIPELKSPKKKVNIGQIIKTKPKQLPPISSITDPNQPLYVPTINLPESRKELKKSKSLALCDNKNQTFEELQPKKLLQADWTTIGKQFYNSEPSKSCFFVNGKTGDENHVTSKSAEVHPIPKTDIYDCDIQQTKRGLFSYLSLKESETIVSNDTTQCQDSAKYDGQSGHSSCVLYCKVHNCVNRVS